MSFPKDSPFYEKPEGPGKLGTPLVPIRHVGRPNTVEIPVSVLEDWVTGLELAENDGDVRDVTTQMRSYFPG